MLRFLLSCTATFCAFELSAQYLISDSLLIAYTPAELAAQGIQGADHTIEAHRLIYHTIDPFGQPTIASGAVVIPVGSTCQHAIGAYHHGTILNRQDVPSRISGEMVVGYYLAADDYVAVLPDYLGLGDSPGPHPYIHAASEATASRDMLRAAREFCAQRDVQLNGQLFLIGYSQGGHACAATHRLLQEEHADEFIVTASAPCSSPFDVSGVQAQVMVSPDPYPAPYYLPYVILSYRYVYPWLFGEVNEIIEEPWATVLPP
ncbi:MAG TPA: lipase family protein, partial [Flavobacteriales bacterium]|nr:lipase family protein [Flavobacteriales bacterium]